MSVQELRLFVVMLGGRHARANIELHDVVFAIAPSIEQTHEQLRQQWFGELAGLHIDSWMTVDGVEVGGWTPVPEGIEVEPVSGGRYDIRTGERIDVPAEPEPTTEGAAGESGVAPEPPTALVCQSDLLALGAIRAAGERGLGVPHDLSVTGFDG